jgi:hypothetical protein
MVFESSITITLMPCSELRLETSLIIGAFW